MEAPGVARSLRWHFQRSVKEIIGIIRINWLEPGSAAQSGGVMAGRTSSSQLGFGHITPH
jgi:hypothetical protein